MIFWTTLLIIHGLLAIALLGAVTHQAVALWWPVRAAKGRSQTLSPCQAVYMWPLSSSAVTFILGHGSTPNTVYIAPRARTTAIFKTVGVFEFKEHGDD